MTSQFDFAAKDENNASVNERNWDKLTDALLQVSAAAENERNCDVYKKNSDRFK
jgi:hypothetical protein